jgi:hypothetical protein
MGNKEVKIDKKEIYDLFENINFSKLDEIVKVMKKYDKDGNGYLDREEYMALSSLFLERVKELNDSDSFEEKVLKKFYLTISNFEKIDLGN